MQKRGQLLGMPLLLLFGLIVGALILFFGIRWIQNLTLEAEYVSVLDTLQEIDTTIQTFRNYDAGSSKVYAVDVPQRIEKICFYDSSDNVRCTVDGEPCSENDEALLDLLLTDQYNVYLLPGDVYDKNRFSIASFVVEEGNPVCVTPGKDIRFTAEEDIVRISYA